MSCQISSAEPPASQSVIGSMAGGVVVEAASAEPPASPTSIGDVAGGCFARSQLFGAAFLLGANGLGGAWVDAGDLAGMGLGIGVDLVAFAALAADGGVVFAGLATGARMGGGLGNPALSLALRLGGTGGMAEASPSSRVSWAAATGADSGATRPPAHLAFLGGGLGNPALSLLLLVAGAPSSSNSGHGNMGSDDSSVLADFGPTTSAAHLSILAGCFLGGIRLSIVTLAFVFEPDTATNEMC
jgi:hypothetical protein